MNNPTVILGVIGSDCHSVGNKVLDAFLTERGFRVVNLGVMVSPDEFIEAALKNHAAAILVSSLYGHGELDCAGFRDRCKNRGLNQIVLCVGGNLVVGKTPREVVQRKFQAMGFDHVFFPSDDLEEFVRCLRKDLQEKEMPKECQMTNVPSCHPERSEGSRPQSITMRDPSLRSG